LMIVVLAASAVVLWPRRQWLRTLPGDPQVQLMLAATGILFAIGLTLGALPWDRAVDQGFGAVWSVHVPDMPGDPLLQFRTAQILQNRLPIQTTPFYINYWYISDRTPLIGLMTTFLTAAAGISLPKDLQTLSAPYQLVDPYGYWLYREISMLTNAMVAASAVLVAWELLGARAAKLGAVFIALSPFVLINILFQWPKLLAGFFIVGFYFWSWIKRRPVLAGIFAAGGVLSHPVAALFLPSMFIYLLVVRRWRQLIISGVTATLVALPWFFWTIVIYRHSSRLLTYPIGYAIEDPTNPGPGVKAAWQAFLRRSPWSILNDRWSLFRDAFLAWQFPHLFLAPASLKGLGTAAYEFCRLTFPGMFGVGLALFGYLSWVRVITQSFWAVTLGGSTLCVLLFWGIPSDALTISAFQPMTGLWIALAAGVLARFPGWVSRVVILITCVEWIGFAYLLILKVPPVSTWRITWALLALLSLVLVAAAAIYGWTASRDQPEATGGSPSPPVERPVTA
ncbi:MAG TPA: hypothetical protein VNU19_04215, partial [Candidatus Acidoferrum sp.]|nr:hypothetical protein [Candidatus Acidoferrum sp.]